MPFKICEAFKLVHGYFYYWHQVFSQCYFNFCPVQVLGNISNVFAVYSTKYFVATKNTAGTLFSFKKLNTANNNCMHLLHMSSVTRLSLLEYHFSFHHPLCVSQPDQVLVPVFDTRLERQTAGRCWIKNWCCFVWCKQ